MALRLQPTSSSLLTEFQECFDALQSERRLLPLRRRTKVPVRVVKEEGERPQTHDGSPQTRPSTSTAVSSAALPVLPPSTTRAEQGSARASDRASLVNESIGAVSAAVNVRDRVAAAATGAVELIAKAAVDHAPPKSSTDFETTWKRLKGDKAAQASYLRRIDPASLPLLFKTSLTGPLLSGVAAAALADMQESLVAAQGSPEWAVALLEGLTQVPRFDMTAMLLPRADKAALKGSLEACAVAAADKPELCARLAAVRAKLKV